MYERFYRLRERPFALTPDPDYLYPSRVHREAMNYLRYGIETHGRDKMDQRLIKLPALGEQSAEVGVQMLVA